MNNVEKNLLKIKDDIAPYTPKIIAVTKYYGIESIIEAYEAGLRDFGESKAFEAVEKINQLPENIKKDSIFHFIGHLQSNKAKKVVGNFEYIHSVDSLKLAQVISDEALRQGIVQKVLLQVNNANEEQKFGFLKEEIFSVFGKIKVLEGLEIVGLMNIAPYGLESDELIRLFKDIVKVRDNLENQFDCTLSELSMGMSGDYKEAVVAGATIIRVGRKLFS